MLSTRKIRWIWGQWRGLDRRVSKSKRDHIRYQLIAFPIIVFRLNGKRLNHSSYKIFKHRAPLLTGKASNRAFFTLGILH